MIHVYRHTVFIYVCVCACVNSLSAFGAHADGEKYGGGG